MAYKLKSKKLKDKGKKKQSYIWKINYETPDKERFTYSQQSITKEKAIQRFKLDNPKGKLTSIELNKDTPTPEDVKALERAYLQGARAGMKF